MLTLSLKDREIFKDMLKLCQACVYSAECKDK